MLRKEIAAQCSKFFAVGKSSENGFSLVEAIIALMILTVALISVVLLFTYATQRNTGNNLKSQALAVLQQEVEQLRAAKFTPQVTDAVLTGGTKAARIVTSADGSPFQVLVTVDDDPTTNGVQINTASTLKEVTLNVSTQNAAEAWVRAVPTTIVFRRVRSN
jgi:type II secretory pathway pseudopilin PulG